MGPNESKLIQTCVSLELLSGHFEYVTVYLGLVTIIDQYIQLQRQVLETEDQFDPHGL